MTAEYGVITVRCAVHSLQLSVHDFFKANFSAKEVVSNVKISPKRPTNRISEHNNKPLPRLDCKTHGSFTFLMF